ncbi:MAG: hypothetical protein ACRBBN_00490 [Methyloligellaceae bacterium]
MVDIIKVFAEQFGLVALYAVIVLYMGFTANGLKHLIFMLGIVCGVFITMFQAFNLKSQFGFLDVTQFVPVSQDIGNIAVAVVFVYVLGFVAYGLKQTIAPSEA